MIHYPVKHSISGKISPFKSLNDLQGDFSAKWSRMNLVGGKLDTWFNQGKSPVNAIQANDSFRPSYDESSGHPEIVFDGVSTYLILSSMIAGASSWDIYCVCMTTNNAESKHLFGGRSTTSNADNLNVYQVAAGTYRTIYNNTVVTHSDLAITENELALFRSSFDGTEIRGYKNGVLSSVSGSSSGVVSDIPRTIGAFYQHDTESVSQFWQGNIRHILIFDKNKTSSEDSVITDKLIKLNNISL